MSCLAGLPLDSRSSPCSNTRSPCEPCLDLGAKRPPGGFRGIGAKRSRLPFRWPFLLPVSATSRPLKPIPGRPYRPPKWSCRTAGGSWRKWHSPPANSPAASCSARTCHQTGACSSSATGPHRGLSGCISVSSAGHAMAGRRPPDRRDRSVCASVPGIRSSELPVVRRHGELRVRAGVSRRPGRRPRPPLGRPAGLLAVTGVG